MAAASSLFVAMPAACSQVVLELGCGTVGAAELFAQYIEQGVRRRSAAPIETLVVELGRCGLDEAWCSSSVGVAVLERACADKGIAVEVRI